LGASPALATGSTLDLHPHIQQSPPPTATTSAPLWDREAELALINSAIQGVRGGDSRIVVIEGPSGIGKTRLLLAAQRVGRLAGVRIASARASELERDYPFGIARQWIEPALSAASADERNALLDGAARPAAQVLSTQPPSPPLHVELALHSLYWLIANLSAQRPLLLLLDDAQWADASSLRLLNYLAPRAEGLALGLLLTSRPPELGEAGSLLERLLTDPFVDVLRPAELGTRAATAALLATTGVEPDPAFVSAALAATGGNPFYLIELGRALALERIAPTAQHIDRIAGVRPQTLSRAILGRVSADARALAAALAVLEEPSDLLLAADVAGLHVEQAARAADELTRAGLIGDERPLEFRHAIVRGAVLSGVTAGVRAAAHLTAATALLSRGAALEQVVGHLLASDPAGAPRTVATLRAAAARALRAGAPDVAVRLLERAAVEPPDAGQRGAVIAELAGARYQAGMRDERTVDLLREAYRLLDDPVRRAELLRDLAWVVGPDLAGQSELEPMFEETIDALSLLEGTRGLSLRLRAAQLTGMMLDVDQPAFGSRIAGLEQLDGSDPAEGPLIALLARYKLGTGAPASEVTGVALRAIANPQTLTSEGPDSLWLVNAVVILFQADCLAEVEELLARARDRARALGSATGFALVCVHRARTELRRGRLLEAEAEARAALGALTEPSWHTISATAMLMESLIYQGRPTEAETAYDALGFGTQIPDIRPATPILITRGRLREQQGDLDQAALDLSEAITRIGRFNAPNAVGLDARLRLIYVHRARGELTAARAAAAGVLAIATIWGTPGAIGEAQLAQAAVASDAPSRISLLREAVTHLAASPARLEHARALIDLGAALRRAGSRTDSRSPLREGLAFAEQAGAGPLADRARDELAASGIRLRRQSEDRDRLTPSEQRIARLAAEGFTNPQIAQALFLTIKTVEGHLSNAYRKLGVAGRRELGEALERIRG
jgi:DNA-binding CsgD family transcriptional regulator